MRHYIENCVGEARNRFEEFTACSEFIFDRLLQSPGGCQNLPKEKRCGQKKEEVLQSSVMIAHTSLAKQFQRAPHTLCTGREPRRSFKQNHTSLVAANNPIYRRGLGRAPTSNAGDDQLHIQRQNDGLRAKIKVF